MTFQRLLLHFVFDLLAPLGVRDRLRCPKCGAVGTWKPHGGWLDRADTRKVRRWLCKCCGYYIGPEGVKWCYPGDGAWTFLEQPEQLSRTPSLILKRHKVWPWRE